MSARSFSLLGVAITVPAMVFGPLLACGGDSKAKPDAKIVVVDSKLGDAAAACTATASYATPNFGSNARATNYPAKGSGGSATPHELDFTGPLNADPSPDYLFLQLYAGYGGFGSGDIRNGTYTISGADAKFSTCGICPIIVTDVHQQGSGVAITDFYTATGGTVTLTSVTGTFTASVSNLTFAHVTTGSDGLPSDTAVGDCNATIPSAALSAPIIMGSAAGKPDGQITLRGRYR